MKDQYKYIAELCHRVDVHQSSNGNLCITEGDDGVCLTREEAIAAAHAILKHFDAMPGLVGKEEW